MNSFCKKCGLCCRLIPIIKDKNLLIRDGLQQLDKDLANKLIPLTKDAAIDIDNVYVESILTKFPEAEFYSCSMLGKNNLCSMKKAPSVCRSFPSSPLAFIPEDCGYCGYIFLLNEELKSRIRKIKEEILEYETLMTSDSRNSKSYKKIADNLRRFVDKYSEYGSEEW